MQPGTRVQIGRCLTDLELIEKYGDNWYDHVHEMMHTGPVGTIIHTAFEPDHHRLVSATVRWDDGRLCEYGADENDTAEQPGDAAHYDCYDLCDVTPCTFVNIYLHDRAYGGPEEGGWYYDTYDPVYSQCKQYKDAATAEYAFDAAKEWCAARNEIRPSMSSVLSQGKYVAMLQAWPASYRPERRPHYS